MVRVFTIDCFYEACKNLIQAHRFIGMLFALSSVVLPVIVISNSTLKIKMLQQISFYWLLPAFCLPLIFRVARYFLLRAKIQMVSSFHNISHEFLDEQIKSYYRVSFAILAVQALLLIFTILSVTRYPFFSIILCISSGIAQQWTVPDYSNWQDHQLEKREQHQEFFKH